MDGVQPLKLARFAKLRGLAAIACILTLFGPGCGNSHRSEDGDGESGVCTAGDTRDCVGRGACRGGQRCDDDGRWAACVCGTTGTGGAGQGGGETGGAGGVNGTGGAGGVNGTGGTGAGPSCGVIYSTTLSGTVRDPSGSLPLPNVYVYVDPAPAPIAEGVTCSRCNGVAAGASSVSMTDATGRFVLDLGDSFLEAVPLVVETGKWRRQTTISRIEPCADNPVDDDLVRLPRTSTEGHLPLVAVSTGGSDSLECLFRRLGIADREFTNDAGAGRVHLFSGCDDGTGYFPTNRFSTALGGQTFARTTTLLADAAKLAQYDAILFSCEGHSCDEEKEPYRDNLEAYSDAGGRLWLDHMHYRWLSVSLSDRSTLGEFSSGDDLPDPFTLDVDTSFPRGASFADWLVTVGASSEEVGKLSIHGGQSSLGSVDSARSTRWLHLPMSPTSGGPATQAMTFETPLGVAAEEACGRTLFTDIHVMAGDASGEDVPFPDGCVDGELSAQEKALAYLLFELTGCLALPFDIESRP